MQPGFTAAVGVLEAMGASAKGVWDVGHKLNSKGESDKGGLWKIHAALRRKTAEDEMDE